MSRAGVVLALVLAAPQAWALQPVGLPASAGMSGPLDRIVRVQAPGGLEVAPAPGAVLRGLDKIAGAAEDLEVAVGDSVSFGRLTITLTECRYPVGNPAGDGYAHVIIHDAREAEPVFRGWMVAASPALNALDHPRFDVWLIRCTSP